ncbi:MAG: hypothetical protein LBI57_03985 [Helicobacteraceae bacterium]|jgi:hypothetical protein|nr:hypothetical protein [Helicobacteraceae bacterium]
MSGVNRDTAFEMAEKLDRVQCKLLFISYAIGGFGEESPSESAAFGAALILDDLRGEITAVKEALRPTIIAGAGL